MELIYRNFIDVANILRINEEGAVSIVKILTVHWPRQDFIRSLRWIT